MNTAVAKLDEWGRPGWIALMVLAFIVFWPLGLAILAYMIWSGRMGCSYRHGPGRWQHKMEHLQEKMDHLKQRMERGPDWWGEPPPSGNRAFDEYRTETLRRLEEEQREFREFLDRLRLAKDKAEFDEFMASRRRPPEGPAAQPQT
jgi:hypothetical protein